MKQVLKAAGGLLILVHIAIGILLVTIIGCGEAEDPLELTEMVKSGADVEPFGAMKKVPDMAPAAPTAVPEGTPTVKSVGYYSDWQLTEEINHEEPVPVGTIIYIHVVFSEPVKHRITDNPEKDGALPVLFYWINGGITRFRIMQHGASGEDFVSGDAKPKGGGTDDFVCKYRVKEEDKGSPFWIRIGRWSVDLEGNLMHDHYVHKTRLRLGEKEEPVAANAVVKTPADDTEKTAEPTQPTDTTPPTVLSITHYHSGETEPIAEGAEIPVSTIDTKIVFSEPVTPSITYTTGNRTRAYTLSPIGGIHWRNLCKPTDETGTIWLCKQNAATPSFTVTVTTDTVDRAGNALAELVTTPELTVIKPVVVTKPREPAEPVDTEPTVPEEPTEPEPPTFVTDDPHLQKAIEVIKMSHMRISDIESEIVEKALKIEAETGSYPWGWVNGELDKIIIEETGLAYFTVDFLNSVLIEIYRAANPQDSDRIRLGNYSSRGTAVEYLRLYFTYPSKTKNELLELFHQSCRAGKVSIEEGQFF